MSEFERNLQRAADALARRSAILVASGAGMGVDSGLPDFRGNEGFWRAYPPYKHLGLRFDQMADPRWFRDDPGFAWGFYGHRLNLYRATAPHAGFKQLLDLADASSGFAFTSNVDGHFQRAGWSEDQVYEVHGSIHTFQCAAPCSDQPWGGEGETVEVDEQTFRARGDLPSCPRCGGVARPNILMFGDVGFSPERSHRQGVRYRQWLDGVELERLVIVEIGAGTAIPTVRWEGEELQQAGAQLIRINPRESQGPGGTISLPSGGLAALEAIAALG